MSSEIAIKIDNLSKCYQVYRSPQDRLKQFVLPKFQSVLGLVPNKYYKEFWALKDISLEIKKGESVGILGRNGSGKSTLLQLICGTLSPTTGSVETFGRIAALLELGSGFNPDFTGRENVYLNGSLLGLTATQIDDKFDSIAAFADIGDFIEQPVKTYSSGMLIRLAFAVQVQVEPDILVVDEALAVGDALFQKRCYQRIERLISNGTTLLFVSHDQESVRTLTSRALLLKHGNNLAWGLSSDVVLEYRRQLHDDESVYFSTIAKNLSKNAKEESFEQHLISNKAEEPQGVHRSTGVLRSESLSFGDGGVKIQKVEVFDLNEEVCSVFYPGDDIKIRVTCHSSVEIDKLNVSVRIRNKEGIKIYSWGTLNQDMVFLNTQREQLLFWNKKLSINENFSVDLLCKCTLGVNLYEIQAAVSYEETPDYLGQRILHWMDEAAFFQVLMKKNEYFFGGVLDMKMQASWSK